ncbi:DUF4192 domain-containing protein [Amycolatopsis rhabdoformis]|uniref:DUF4192 domain-containing protein n=1 Tax=Amycolatopsis rhabdoformis TaxID=1448059 RepID=A0ABZ1I984_9PSEU|nr:DUF4192 domain-containing protein [Amycolatopsis rhabdoformis]WSE30757.1 DUF4192 domain-containing protein [Amycolatopsis rhabdoformis]
MTTSTPPGTARTLLTDPAQLIAALPYLLGFTPADSVVLLGHRPPGTRIGLILRADLPPRDLLAHQADALAPRFRVDDHTGVTMVIVGGRAGPDGDPPHLDFADEVERALGEYGLPLLHPLWTPEITAAAPWACYREPTCGGVLPDPRATVTAATTTNAGFVTFAHREDLLALLQPRSTSVLARRRVMLSRATAPAGSDADLRAAAADVRAAFVRHRRGDGPPTDDQAVRLAHALALPKIRDACLATATPSDSPVAMAAMSLWLELVRELPAPHRAHAAALAGYAALMRNEGALAGMALANALDAHPGHVLAQLLHTVWDLGSDPAKISGLASLPDAVDLGLSVPELAQDGVSPDGEGPV